NCFAPTAPLVSGGTKATPSRWRVSSALWPSKFTLVLTLVSGPAKVDATESFFELLNVARAGRAVGIRRVAFPEILAPALASCDSGAEVSCLEAAMTSRLLP